METNNIKLTFKGNPINLIGNEIKIGDKASDITVSGNSLNPVKLSDFQGKSVILSIFTSLNTAVCATQNRKFNQ